MCARYDPATAPRATAGESVDNRRAGPQGSMIVWKS
jgi:hypothetical protein